MMPATDAERRTALQVGAALLEAVYPRQETTGLVHISPNVVGVRAYRDADGVVRVVQQQTGDLVVQSLPAQYTSLDCTLFATMRTGKAADAFEFFLGTLDEAEALGKVADFAASPQAARMTAPELAHVLRGWAQRLEDCWG